MCLNLIKFKIKHILACTGNFLPTVCVKPRKPALTILAEIFDNLGDEKRRRRERSIILGYVCPA